VPSVQLIIAIIGCATALLSAAIAVTQNDLKRVMAYSTVSQLGYMFMALGAGIGDVAQLAIVAAMFHLSTHAFFKALLFLASGSVMHAMGDVIDMRRFRGLRHRLPITCWTFAVGGLALAAIPPLSGFFSKDEVLNALSGASHSAHEHGWGWIYAAIYWLAILTAFLTAFYTGRAFFMTFFGTEKLPSPDDPEAQETDETVAHEQTPHGGGDEGHAHGGHHEIGHESPPIITIPLIALAGCTVLIGLICLVAWPFTGGPAEWFAHHLEKSLAFESLGHGEHGFSWLTAIIGTLVGVVVGPLRGLARFSDWLDENLVDRLVVGVALVPRAIARARMARYQNGLIQFYAASSAMSVALLLLALMTDVTVVLGLLVVLVIVLYVGSRLRPAAAREPMRVGRAEGDV
jgi:NADH-quinone oxidoreductase subunit L